MRDRGIGYMILGVLGAVLVLSGLFVGTAILSGWWLALVLWAAGLR